MTDKEAQIPSFRLEQFHQILYSLYNNCMIEKKQTLFTKKKLTGRLFYFRSLLSTDFIFLRLSYNINTRLYI